MLSGLAALKGSKLCKVGGFDIIKEVESVHNIVKGISTGHGPEAEDVARYSSLKKTVMAACEHFCTLERAPAGALALGGKHSGSTLFGREAMKSLLIQVRNKDKSGKEFKPGDTKVFRSFKFMLSPEDHELTNQLILEVNKGNGGLKCLKDGPAGEEGSSGKEIVSNYVSRRCLGPCTRG